MTSGVRLAVVIGVFLCCLPGWAVASYAGGVAGLVLGMAILVVPWFGQPLWCWTTLYLRRKRPFELVEPVTVANDRSSGGLRFQSGVAVTAVQLLGKTYRPTIFIGSAVTQTANTVDISQLQPHLRQSLGLTIESLTLVSSGYRRRNTGDYPRVYDTFIGTSPYAGRRETWMILRIRSLENSDALQYRDTAGTAALAATQRISAALRCQGIRARVATAIDILELERRIGSDALEPNNRCWRSTRGSAGWHSTYAYCPADITSENLDQAWSLPADGITQNITVFPDGGVTATVTVRTAQPATASPSVTLQTLPGEQAAAIAANLCCPLPKIRGLRRGRLSGSLSIPIGSSGVLLGKTSTGGRLMLPLSDPGEASRVHVSADDPIAKRIVIRAAGAGERITVHTKDVHRWDSVRMPNVLVTNHPRPAPGTTVSVVDGTVQPTPRPNAVISVSPLNTAVGRGADVVIAQTSPGTVSVTADDLNYELEFEFFRAENRYISESVGMLTNLVPAD